MPPSGGPGADPSADGAAPARRDLPREVAVALGGGGARSLAHVGAYRALLGAGVRVVAWSGSSTGALVAAMGAAGLGPDAMLEVARSALSLGLLDLDPGPGLIEQEAIARALRPVLPERFEDLPAPLAVVATDVRSGERLVLRSGPLLDAALASNAFPGLFSPVRLDGRDLIDGGATENVPIGALREVSGAPALAWDVSLPRDEQIDLEAVDVPRWTQPLRRLAGQVTGPVALLRKAYVISQSELIARSLADHPDALVLRPRFPRGFGILSLGRFEEAAEIGERAAREAWGLEGPATPEARGA